MATLEELKRDNEKLKNIATGKKEMKRIGLERKNLMKENFEYKHPKRTAFLKVSKSFGKSIVATSKPFIKNFAKSTANIVKNGLQGNSKVKRSLTVKDFI